MKPKRLLNLKTCVLAFMSTVGIAQAAIVEFDLSPAGSSAAVGLNGANEVSPVAGTGSGDEISGGIYFDTDTNMLSFTIGYGSAAGFTDLTGPAVGAHIHGPANASANAAVLFDLATVHFPAANPALGGVIFGSTQYTASQATDLLANLNYVNLHTSTNPGGEIRGQLVRVNTAPEIDCEEEMTVECGKSVTYSATVSDFDGNAVQVVWSLNGKDVQTDNIAAGTGPTSQVLNYTTKLHLGINVLNLTATDSEGEVTTCDMFVTAEDTEAPVIKSVSADPAKLWPPNKKLVEVNISAKVKDACDEDPTWKVISISSDQGDSSDWTIVNNHTVKLRAERSGKDKDGRTYRIKVQATDDAGNKSKVETVRVTVPHDKGKRK